MIFLECNSNPDGAYSYWRGKRPNIELEQYGHRFITEEDKFDMNYDAVFISEPSTAHSFNLIKNKQSWVDCGDYCIDLPPYNPAHLRYKQGGEYWFLKCLEKATYVTVSTGFIKEKLSKYHDNIFIVPNAIKPAEIKGFGKNNLVYYRGSQHHTQDLTTHVFPPISYPYLFAGTPHPTQDCLFLEPVPDVKRHFWRMGAISPKFAVFPLFGNDFNRAKSNIMFLESTMCGAVLLAPNWEEWQHEGIINYSDFTEDVKSFIKISDEERYKKWAASVKTVTTHFNLNNTTIQRLELIGKFLVS